MTQNSAIFVGLKDNFASKTYLFPAECAENFDFPQGIACNFSSMHCLQETIFLTIFQMLRHEI